MNSEAAANLRETLRTESPTYEIKLSEDSIRRLSAYFELLSDWNPRLHLVGPTSPAKFATRHILESLLMTKHLPENAKVADVGSGGGLPIIPCLIVRPDVTSILIESNSKKAVFLHEALVQTHTVSQAEVKAARFENIDPPEANFVSSRALERLVPLFPKLVNWVPKSTLLFFGGQDLAQQIARTDLLCKTVPIPNTERSFLFVLKRK
jgi:16S rRNA (guanine527-N7)-methyltransferase